MSSPDYSDVLRVLKCADNLVRYCVRVGSRVYGTVRAESDHDFLVVLSDAKAKQDLVWGAGINVVVHGRETYVKALAEQSVFALEGLFAPKQHRLKDSSSGFSYRCDRERLYISAKSRSDSDFAKAAKRFAEEPEVSKKRLLHALRVPAFANQVAMHGSITDFLVAQAWWDEIQSNPATSWEDLSRDLQAVREALLEQLRCPIKR